jgi:RNA polymerase sigma-70 factor (sigma-E family)
MRKGGSRVLDEPGAAGLELFLAERGDALLRTAALLAASRPGGEDLLQEALERLVRRWHVIDGDPEPYLRRTMYNLAIDGWRRHARRPEVLGLPVTAAVPGHADGIDQRLSLIQAMRGLPPRERAALVARYWEDMSEAEAAAAIGCSVSAVKSAASRGLRRLREAASAPDAGRARAGSAVLVAPPLALGPGARA